MDISIGIVGHGHRAYLETLFSSLFNTDIQRSYEVIFVENNVHDGSTALVKEAYPRVRLICNQHSYSFAENNNIAFAASSGKYFLMLNPDKEVQKGAIGAMAAFLDSTPQSGACGPKLLFPDGSLQHSCRRFPTLKSFLLRRTPLRFLQPAQYRDKKHLMVGSNHKTISQVDWLLGACIMVRRELYERLGGLDERYEMYCEDIDFCRRLQKIGRNVYYVPHAVVVHHHLAETDKTFFTRKTRKHFKSMLRYVVNHGIKMG